MIIKFIFLPSRVVSCTARVVRDQTSRGYIERYSFAFRYLVGAKRLACRQNRPIKVSHVSLDLKASCLRSSTVARHLSCARWSSTSMPPDYHFLSALGSTPLTSRPIVKCKDQGLYLCSSSLLLGLGLDLDDLMIASSVCAGVAKHWLSYLSAFLLALFLHLLNLVLNAFAVDPISYNRP